MTNEQETAGGAADEGAASGAGDDGSAGQDIQRQFNDAIAKLSGPGEQLVILGAVLLVFVDIFGDLIFEEWGVSYEQLVPAWFVIAAVILFRFRGSTLPVSYVLLLAVLGLVAGFVGVREFLGDLRNDVFDRDTASVIYALITWAGSALMLVGAVQLWPTAKNG
jgi:small-conductance mechanosensitive channel